MATSKRNPEETIGDQRSRAESSGNDAMFLTRRQVAEMLSLSERTIYERTKNKDIPFVRLGRIVRYPWVQLSKWLEQRTVTPQQAVASANELNSMLEPGNNQMG